MKDDTTRYRALMRHAMAKRYTIKPLDVEAVQYTGDNFRELYDLAGNEVYFQDGWIYLHKLDYDIKMENKIGDWLIKDSSGNCYFCEKHVFDSTYEETKDSPSSIATIWKD